MSTAISRADFDRARSQVYDLLAATFDGDMVVLERTLEDRAFADLVALLPGDVDATNLTRDDVDTHALSLGSDNLFVVPGPHFVPPFASAHLDSPESDFESDSPYHEEGRAGELYGDPARRMASLYEAVDYSPDVGEGIPDHVAAQLDFMAVLARTKARIRDGQGDADVTLDEIETLEAHALDALTWLDPFASAVAESDPQEGIFAALAEFAASFVTWDRGEH